MCRFPLLFDSFFIARIEHLLCALHAWDNSWIKVLYSREIYILEDNNKELNELCSMLDSMLSVKGVLGQGREQNTV